MGWSRINARRRRYVSRWSQIWAAAYRKVGRDYVTGIREGGYAAVEKKPDVEILKQTYVDMYVDIGVKFARTSTRMLKGSETAMDQKAVGDQVSQWIQIIEEYIALQCADLIVSIQETAFAEMLRIVKGITSQGINEGLGIEAIGSRIAESFAGEWKEAAKWMGRRVAQTETIRAANYGTKVGVESLGIPFTKSWLFGPNARETHQQAGADNDRIPQDQPFIVGGYECDFPGDPGLPPEESINCRCSWTADPAD